VKWISYVSFTALANGVPLCRCIRELCCSRVAACSTWFGGWIEPLRISANDSVWSNDRNPAFAGRSPWLGGAILAGGLVGPALLLLGLIGCGDRYINRRHCRRRGRYERIRKDLSVTTPTRKFFPAGGLSAVTLTKVPATWRPLPPPLSTFRVCVPGADSSMLVFSSSSSSSSRPLRLAASAVLREIP
jgi:hypothetical protein